MNENIKDRISCILTQPVKGYVAERRRLELLFVATGKENESDAATEWQRICENCYDTILKNGKAIYTYEMMPKEKEEQEEQKQNIALLKGLEKEGFICKQEETEEVFPEMLIFKVTLPMQEL